MEKQLFHDIYLFILLGLLLMVGVKALFRIRNAEKKDYVSELNVVIGVFSSVILGLLYQFNLVPLSFIKIGFPLIGLFTILVMIIGIVIQYRLGSFDDRFDIKERISSALKILLFLAIFLIVIFSIKFFIK